MTRKKNRNKQKPASSDVKTAQSLDSLPQTSSRMPKNQLPIKQQKLPTKQQYPPSTNPGVSKPVSNAFPNPSNNSMEHLTNFLATHLPTNLNSPPRYVSLHHFQEILHDYESRLLATHEHAFSKKEAVLDTMKKAWKIFDKHKSHYRGFHN